MGGQADQRTRTDSGGVVIVGAGNDILVVDDDRAVLEFIKEHLADEGYSIVTSDTGITAVKYLKERTFNLLLVDKNLPDINGLAIIKMCRESSPDTEAVLMTAHASLTSAIEAIGLGAYDYVLKPFDPAVLREKVRKAMDHQRVKYENKVLMEFLKKANEDLEESKKQLEMQVRTRTVTEDVCSTVVRELKSLKGRLHEYCGRNGAELPDTLRKEEERLSRLIGEIGELAGLTVVDAS